uniref:HDC07244 n=1 Tax=Drosophila melanogaster TaxID=7227 RepID=Q6IG45_DROME|nr:TPA_inf: HDC07244 [Drosophila melanogaster]
MLLLLQMQLLPLLLLLLLLLQLRMRMSAKALTFNLELGAISVGIWASRLDTFGVCTKMYPLDTLSGRECCRYGSRQVQRTGRAAKASPAAKVAASKSGSSCTCQC